MSQHPRTLPYRPSTRPGTITATQTQTETPVLRLRAVQDESEPNLQHRPRLQWAEDVIDNEGMGKKKSKLCCIYHAPRPVGESSSESSSDSSSDSDSDGGVGDDGKARMGGQGKRKAGEKEDGKANSDKHDERNHNHDHEGCEHPGPAAWKRTEKAAAAKGKGKSGNAYEVQPKPTKRNKTAEATP